MTTATISISKNITKIANLAKGVSVTMHKLSDFAFIIDGFSVVTINGTSKPSKVAKFQKQLIEMGYTLSTTNWIENAGFIGDNADVINFSFIYTKTL